MLVERYVRAVCERGLDVDSILVITYTRKAAGELRSRIRAALVERDRPDLARELDGAWISTIHGFCNRLLKAHPFAVGLDPRFRELEDAGAAVLRGEAFERALEVFCAGGDEERLRLLATYRADGLRRMLTGVYETLRSAGRPLVLELGERSELGAAIAAFRTEASCLVDDSAATANQRGSATEALRIVTDSAPAARVVDLSAFQARGSRAASYELARKAVERSSLEELASHDRDLLQELLEGFAAEYAAAKRRESAVDFEDLQLAARDVLLDDDEVRDSVRLRFRLVMVDEFQDTNGLQCEIVDLVAHPELTEVFTVGDEFQSIYGFRHADVEVFRERRAQAANLLTLRSNYRSRPQVLAAVNFLFAGAFGDEYQPLAASAEFADPVFGHPVELMVTDKSSYRDSGEHWRHGEARAIAARVRELVDAGAALPGEIVVLFAAGTDAERYEEALRLEGLPTYRATGRGYFGQQQVVDLLAYLRLLHNRYDDVALATVLASPLVGVSNDTLVLLRRNATRRPLFTAIEKGLPEGLAVEDGNLLRAFLQRYDRLVAASTRVGLERLCEQVLAEHDYDLAVLARWDGSRRFANLRKLGRLARQYEAIRGADLPGFVRFVREQDALGAKELEAVAEEEGADAVRLLTIHGAKGLEFKVVIVADAGRDVGGPRGGDEIVALSDGRFGFRMVHPTHGERRPVFDFEQVREAEKEQEQAERLRLYYVAMTRAIDRLIVSGAIDPERAQDRETPIGWVLDRLAARENVVAAGDDPVELERGEARFLLRVDRGRDADVDRRLAEAGPGRSPVRTKRGSSSSSPSCRAAPLRSGSSCRSWHRRRRRLCTTCAASRTARSRSSSAAPTATSRSACSACLQWLRGACARRERADSREPRSATRSTACSRTCRWPRRRRLRAASWTRRCACGTRPRRTRSSSRIAGLVDAYCRSALATRLASLAGARPERPFAFEHDGVLLHGRLDVLWRENGRALVVDYKSNALEGADPHEIVESEYRIQRLVYALACLRDGAEEVEVAYQFLERPEDVVAATFTVSTIFPGSSPSSPPRSSASALESSCRRRASSPARDCPALDLLCAGPRLSLSSAR